MSVESKLRKALITVDGKGTAVKEFALELLLEMEREKKEDSQ